MKRNPGLTHSGGCWRRHKYCHHAIVDAFKLDGMGVEAIAMSLCTEKLEIEEAIRAWLKSGRKV